MKKNFIDRVIEYVNPSKGAMRARNRKIISIMEVGGKRKYEGASSGRRTDGWISPETDANSAALPAIYRLRNRSRDLVRNNPYMAKGISVISNRVVGKGVKAQPFAKNQKSTENVEMLWKSWAGTTSCHSAEQLDFYGIQALVMRAVAESGDVFIRRRKRRSADGLQLPMQLQVLEPDFLDTSRDGELPNGNRIVGGIEFNRLGKRVGYYMFDRHPGDRNPSTSLDSKRISAKEIIHCYRIDRPGQVRGVPWTAPIMIRLRDLDEYEDAQLVRQKIAACYAGFVRDMEPPETGMEDEEGDILDKLEPGIMEYLPPGKDIEFTSPPGVDGYGEYMGEMLHSIATGLGITYASLTGNLSRVNFSSARMGEIDMDKNVCMWRNNIIINQLNHRVWDWFVEARAVAGFGNDPVNVIWTPPRKEFIDPTKEVPAMIKEIRAGLSSQSEVLRQRGYDPKEVFDEIKRDNEILDKLDLVLDADPRADANRQSQQVEEEGSEGARNEAVRYFIDPETQRVMAQMPDGSMQEVKTHEKEPAE